MKTLNTVKFAIIISIISLFAVSSINAQNICLLGVGQCPGNNNQTTNTSNNSHPTRGESIYRTGHIARSILRSKRYGSRHLVLLDRYWDNNRRCYIEERAWVTSVRASGNGGVVATTSPSKRYCVGRNSLSINQINQAEGWIHYSNNEIYKNLKYQESIAKYLNDRRYQAWARNAYNKAQSNINYYKRYIWKTQNAVNRYAP